MQRRWLNRIIPDPPPVSDEAFARAEREFGVAFPDDYKEVVKIHQGAIPLPNCIEQPGVSTGVEYLYHFEEKPRLSSIIGAYYPIGHALPAKVIPFAAGLGGDYFCFDYRADENNPTIVVLLHDGPAEFVKLADSFKEWLALLTE